MTNKRTAGLQIPAEWIFNRWGEVIYRTLDPQGYWDGIYNGDFVQDGVYIWQATMHDLNGEYYRETGHVTVLR